MYHKVITIGREFGSGGHEIGQRVARELGISFYDRNLVEMASKEMGVDEYSLERVDEAALNGFLSSYRVPDLPNTITGYSLPLNDSMFVTQSDIIQKLAKSRPCIIIGRCADYLLRENPNLISLFICASKEDRIDRIMKRYKVIRRDAEDAIKKTDKKRKNYYETYTDRKWGGIDSHHMILNASLLGRERIVSVIKELYNVTEAAES